MAIVKIDGLDIYYEVAGNGPPLLLINGLAADTRQWEPFVGLLRTAFTVVGYDMRSAGRSDKPDKPFDIKDLAEEAYQLIRHLQFEKTCVLGFSMGGMIAMELALAHREMIDKLFLVSTAPSVAGPHPVSDEMLGMLHRTDVSPALLRQVYDVIFGSKYKKRASADDFIKFRLEDDNPQPPEAYLRQLNAIMSYDCSDRIEGIDVPAHIISGDGDHLIDPKNSIWLHEHLPNSCISILEGVGHIVPLEAAEELAKIVMSAG